MLSCLSLIGSPQVNGTSFTPIPTYPSVTPDIGSLALLDVYVLSFRLRLSPNLLQLCRRGTPGMYGPYDDVSYLYSLIPGSRLVDTSKYAPRARFALADKGAGGQWAVPCDTPVTMSFSFG